MKCNLCWSTNSRVLLNFGSFPIAHQYMNSEFDHREKYPFELSNCADCNHVFVANPISPDILYEKYFTLSDWKFQPHIPRLIEIIKTIVTDKQAKILEVGCNDGRFLKALNEAGYN